MEPFVGQIMAVGFNFPPRNWTFCNGQLLSINENTALFSLLGTTFGGDGRTTFGIPELRGRSIVHVGNGPGLSNISWGQKSGAESVTLNTAHMPAHNHTTTMNLGGDPEEAGAGHFIGKGGTFYTEDASSGSHLNAGAITSGNTGNGQAYNNRNPFLGINYCIALIGLYPSRS